MISKNNQSSPAHLAARIKNAWPQEDPLPENEIDIDLWGDKTVKNYFAERPLSRIDLTDRRIAFVGTYNEAFTVTAKSYYAGVYLANLLRAYAAMPPREDDLAAAHFLGYLTKKGGQPLLVSREQAHAIADVLEFVGDKIDLQWSSEEQVDDLLNAVRYWRERAQAV